MNNIPEYNNTKSIIWLSKILRKRINNTLDLSLSEDYRKWFISFNNYSKKIEINIINSFYKIGYQEDLPCTNWEPEKENYKACRKKLSAPGLKEISNSLIEIYKEKIVINYDIIGLIYWYLNRLEEIDPPEFVLDKHNRFIGKYSHAYKYNYINRPIVDEWINILIQLIKKYFPKIKINLFFYNIETSHDVDEPFKYLFTGKREIARATASYILKKLNAKEAYFNYQNWRKVKNGNLTVDPYNTFDWIMNQSEKVGIKSTFNFICNGTNSLYDYPNYKINNIHILDLIKNINQRGHNIGLHPSYDCVENKGLIKNQFDSIKNIAENLGIKKIKWSSRMHYLRWIHPKTLIELEYAGIKEDTTLGYADISGFRCGTCYEYDAFDPINFKELNIVIKPLILMEGTIINERYMNLNIKDSYDLAMDLKKRCREVNGTFSILWHNSYFTKNIERELYCNILRN